ncbi:MAG: DUF3365 domain-containing protein [Desulfosalsimonadaceae bacterium]|nr:DUF3365 domain-containing protein [Desulfosalsimonadaceae bacterium]
MTHLQKDKEASVTGIFIIIGVVWTLVLAGFYAWEISDALNHTRELAMYQGRSFFQEITTTRSWNALHGGVYVPISETTRPNPYLDVPDRDIVTVEGRKLTKINPAFMTRQIAEVAAKKNLIWFHITSETPIRPGNEPEAWEREALQRFEQGSPEYFDLMDSKTRGSLFRYMAPLRVTAECLKCHAKQGYREGDLRGGISVTLKAAPLLQVRDRQILGLTLINLSIWVFGLFGIVIAAVRAVEGARKREEIIDQLQKALAEVNQLSGLLPICASCKRIRDDKGYWNQIESYIRDHSGAEFSHGICPECVAKLYPGLKGKQKSGN